MVQLSPFEKQVLAVQRGKAAEIQLEEGKTSKTLTEIGKAFTTRKQQSSSGTKVQAKEAEIAEKISEGMRELVADGVPALLLYE